MLVRAHERRRISFSIEIDELGRVALRERATEHLLEDARRVEAQRSSVVGGSVGAACR
jgi:hypothetical protein